jgi:hypothetical protein
MEVGSGGDIIVCAFRANAEGIAAVDSHAGGTRYGRSRIDIV